MTRQNVSKNWRDTPGRLTLHQQPLPAIDVSPQFLLTFSPVTRGLNHHAGELLLQEWARTKGCGPLRWSAPVYTTVGAIYRLTYHMSAMRVSRPLDQVKTSPSSKTTAVQTEYNRLGMATRHLRKRLEWVQYRDRP